MEVFWDIRRIKEIFPQGHPCFFIDRVLEVDKKHKRIKSLKNISINEHFFAGYPPNNPIIPNAVIIEIAFQTSIILYAVLKPDMAKKNPNYHLDKIEAEFIKSVRAGDQLVLEAVAKKISDKGAKMNIIASVDKGKVAKVDVFIKIQKK